MQHSDGLVQGVLPGSLDQAARASELGAEPGRGSRMSAAHMAGVDSLGAPPVSSAAPEAFVDAGRVSRHSAGGHRASLTATMLANSESPRRGTLTELTAEAPLVLELVLVLGPAPAPVLVPVLALVLALVQLY